MCRGGLRLAFPAYRENTQMSEDGFAGRLPWEVVAAVSARWWLSLVAGARAPAATLEGL